MYTYRKCENTQKHTYMKKNKHQIQNQEGTTIKRVGLKMVLSAHNGLPGQAASWVLPVWYAEALPHGEIGMVLKFNLA